MSRPIAQLRDDFENNIQDPLWGEAQVAGSATKAETGGQCVLTLPSSTAGSHSAIYRTSGRYDLTGGSISINIGQMTSTSVAANAFFQLIDLDNTVGQLYWTQQSGSLTARKIDGGVGTVLFTTTWNATTYKYLRIRESGGTIFFDSSTDGVTWTNRASTTTTTPITSMAVQLAATCGNVASPGAFKLNDVNLILPALTSNWRWSQCERPSVDYVKTVTVAASSGQGYIATSVDGATWAYYSGPIGSASGGYAQLVLASSQATAQAMAVNLPADPYARWDLPSLVQCRFVRLYHRSITGSNYILREFYPRRLIQSDDMEAESIKTVNLAANSVTADKVSVINLAALSAFIGKLNIDTSGYLYQGTGTGDAPTTGLKIYNSGGIGRLSTYNSGVEQVTLDTDGALKAGAGAVVLDDLGVSVIASTVYTDLRSYNFRRSSDNAIIGYVTATYASNVRNIILENLLLAGDSGVTSVNAWGSGAGKTATTTVRAAASFPGQALIRLQATDSAATIDITASSGITLNSVTLIGNTLAVSQTVSIPRSSGSAIFALDGTNQGSALSVSNNATATPFGNSRNFSGLILISETAIAGSAAIYLVDGGGGVVLVSQTGTNYSVTATTASKTNVYLVSGAVTIENKLGSTATYNVVAFRSRTQ